MTPIITFFNNKGGVGKTSALYNLSWMYVHLGMRVLVVDLDPQANLTALCLDEEQLEGLWLTENAKLTMYDAVKPLIEAKGDIAKIQYQIISNEYALLAGDLRLSQFEDLLAQEWANTKSGNVRGFNITSAFYRVIMQACEEHEADIVLVDVGPNLGAINRSVLIASDYVVVPLVADLFSLQGLKNLGEYLTKWRTEWHRGKEFAKEGKESLEGYPAGGMQPIGYIVLQHRERQNRLVAAHEKWARRIPEVYGTAVKREPTVPDLTISNDPNKLGLIRNYQSLMAMSHEVRKPVFDLKPADGAIGGHVRIVQESYDTFKVLAFELAKRTGLDMTQFD